jgi:aryl-alcohol dehydrogenase-like predicted oxidoreductase
MKKITLGNTGIAVSYLGFGTGTTDYTVNRTKQSMLEEKELAALLLRGFELGITHWDTATGYDTYRHIARADPIARQRRNSSAFGTPSWKWKRRYRHESDGRRASGQGSGGGIDPPRRATIYRCHNCRHAQRTGIAKEL